MRRRCTEACVNRHRPSERIHPRATRHAIHAGVRITTWSSSSSTKRGSATCTGGRRCRERTRARTHAGRRNADDGPSETRIDRRRGARRRRRPRWATHPRGHHGLLAHEHGALELGRSCSLEVEPTLDACGCGLSVLRTAVGTKHAPPPMAPALDRALSARASVLSASREPQVKGWRRRHLGRARSRPRRATNRGIDRRARCPH